MKAIIEKVIELLKSILGMLPKEGPGSVPSSGDITPWFSLAKKYLGQHEIAGSTDNQFILDCFKHTSYRAGHDEVPWCAAFVCRMLEETGFKGSRSAAAMSFDNYGTKCELKPGAIVTFKWSDGGRHVSICDHIVDSSLVACLGGNQSDAVKVSNYSRERIHSIRWPVRA